MLHSNHVAQSLRSSGFNIRVILVLFYELWGFRLVLIHQNSFSHIAYLRQGCHNSKSVLYQEKLLKVLKCYNFLWVQQRHNCSPAASFVNCVMTLYLLKFHLQTFLSIPITQKCQILSCDTLAANERYGTIKFS